MIDEIIQMDLHDFNITTKSALRAESALVTGGAGFIGSWLCDALISFGCSVTALDNFSTGLSQNIDHLFRNENFKFVESDVASMSKVDSIEKRDLIFHFASRASPGEFQLHPVETMVANSTGTQNLLELARKWDAVFIFASTSEVYGDAEQIPTTETYWGKVNPNGPRSCYDESKRYGEALSLGYRQQYGLDVRIARIFNAYGPRIRSDGTYGRVVSRFITQALGHNEMTVFGDGNQTRSFCYVTDTLAGILKIAITTASNGEVFNIGSPHEISITDLAKEVNRLIGYDTPIVHRPLPIDDPHRRCPDISKALHILDWKPRVDLRKGLLKTIRSFKSQCTR